MRFFPLNPLRFWDAFGYQNRNEKVLITVVQTYIGHSSISDAPLKTLKKSQWCCVNCRKNINGEIKEEKTTGRKKQMFKSMLLLARVEKEQCSKQCCVWQGWKKTNVQSNGA